MSPAIAATPSGRRAVVAPRLKTVTRWPALTASATQGSEIFPVPPTKRTFKLIKRLLSADGSIADDDLRSARDLARLRARATVQFDAVENLLPPSTNREGTGCVP